MARSATGVSRADLPGGQGAGLSPELSGSNPLSARHPRSGDDGIWDRPWLWLRRPTVREVSGEIVQDSSVTHGCSRVPSWCSPPGGHGVHATVDAASGDGYNDQPRVDSGPAHERRREQMSYPDDPYGPDAQWAAQPPPPPPHQGMQPYGYQPQPPASKEGGGCLKPVVIAVAALGALLVVVGFVGAVTTGDDPDDNSSSAPPSSATVEDADETAPSTAPSTTAAPTTTLPPEPPEVTNARRSALQYLEFSGFSRQGLIDQLSSEYGDQYPVDAATAAVDSLNVDWNAEAVEAAEAYLEFQGFSHAGLVDQLSSEYGDQFTPEQAEHGATVALGG